MSAIKKENVATQVMPPNSSFSDKSLHSELSQGIWGGGRLFLEPDRSKKKIAVISSQRQDSRPARAVFPRQCGQWEREVGATS